VSCFVSTVAVFCYPARTSCFLTVVARCDGDGGRVTEM